MLIKRQRNREAKREEDEKKGVQTIFTLFSSIWPVQWARSAKQLVFLLPKTSKFTKIICLLPIQFFFSEVSRRRQRTTNFLEGRSHQRRGNLAISRSTRFFAAYKKKGNAKKKEGFNRIQQGCLLPESDDRCNFFARETRSTDYSGRLFEGNISKYGEDQLFRGQCFRRYSMPLRMFKIRWAKNDVFRGRKRGMGRTQKQRGVAFFNSGVERVSGARGRVLRWGGKTSIRVKGVNHQSLFSEVANVAPIDCLRVCEYPCRGGDSKVAFAESTSVILAQKNAEEAASLPARAALNKTQTPA